MCIVAVSSKVPSLFSCTWVDAGIFCQRIRNSILPPLSFVFTLHTGLISVPDGMVTVWGTDSDISIGSGIGSPVNKQKPFVKSCR